MSYHKKQKQLDIMKKVYEAGLQLLTPTTKEELYPRIAETLKLLIGSAYISIYRVSNEELVKVYTSSSQLKDIFPRKGGFTYKSFQESIPYLINKKNVNTIHPELKKMGLESTLVIPLTFELEPIGVLSLDFKEEQTFSSYIVDALQLFASIVTFKLKNIELESQLRELVDNQKMFISLASHELKNPLTTVLGYASIINRQVKKGNLIEPKTSEVLVAEIHRMSQLIDELLNTKNGNLEKGKLKYNKKKYSFQKLINNTVITWKIAFPKRKVIVKQSITKVDTVCIDVQKMKQVIINLLNNAAKFSSEDSVIEIEFKDDQELVCFIKDEGKGINPSDVKHIFKRFYKGNFEQNKEGMGLGLYLCKEIIESHQGTISVSSQVGRGTTFTIRLPFF